MAARRRISELRDRAAVSSARHDPRAVVRRRRQLAEDRALAAAVDWPRVVLIVGLPKSGTSWFASLVASVPGYAERRYEDPDLCTLEHNVCDGVFESLPGDVLSVLKVHSTAAPENVEVIERHVQKAVVMYRDPRDVTVSRYYHAFNDPAHRHYDLYRRLDRAAGISHSVQQTLAEYVPWIRRWREVVGSDASGRYLELPYEALRADPPARLADALVHWGIDLPLERAAAIVADVQARTRFSLSESSLRRGSVARKGVVGDWCNHFGAEDAESMAEAAGDLLVELGFESDGSWAKGVGAVREGDDRQN